MKKEKKGAKEKQREAKEIKKKLQNNGSSMIAILL